MRYRSPQAQLAVVTAFVFVLLGVSNVVTPSAVSRLVENQGAIRVYSASWRSQLVISVSGILGIIAANVAGPRTVMLIGSVSGAIYSASIVASQYHGTGGGGWYVSAAVVEDIGHTMLTVCLVTVMLTYPREQRKARTLALFQFLVNLSLTLGQVVVVGGQVAAWVRLAACVAAVGVAPWMMPVGRVVRDSGIYVVAGHAELRRELSRLGNNVCSWSMALVVPYMFANPFAVGTLGITFLDRTSVLLYNGGSLSGVVSLGLLLDIGSSCRRRRGVYGFAVTCVLMLLCVVTMIVLDTRKENLRASGSTLFRFTVFVSGMAVSCVFLFSGWVIGSLTNDVWVTARFVGVNMLVAPGMGSLAANAARTNIGTLSLYVGAAIAAVASVGMFFIVRGISDTNTWELTRVRRQPVNTQSAPSSVDEYAGCPMDSQQTTTYYDQSSIAKVPVQSM
ncbi:hypothetical protein GGI20_000998 [Coemansia sp. BCRC 34301]|nr:hypothetical protein GGI20_000998 [Coemansia sp. BCRC 34301]